MPLVKLDNTIGAILSPLQIAWLPGVVTVTGDGFTSTFAVTADPGHPFADAMMVNVTKTGFGVLFIKVPEMLPLPLFAIVPVTAGLFLTQVNVVLETSEDKSIGTILLPEQMVCEMGAGIATGFGYTRTSTIIGVPGQPLAVGVMVNVTVMGLLVLLSRFPLIFPLPLLPIVPVTPGLSLTQLKVVAGTAPVNWMFVIFTSEQVVWNTGKPTASGIGLTTRLTSAEID